MIDAVRFQHSSRASEFLVSELGISETEAQRRIFFVSAKDVLENLLNENRSGVSAEILREWKRLKVKTLLNFFVQFGFCESYLA